jgi:hypothetical protein
MESYYKFDSNIVHFNPGHYHVFNSKTLNSGNSSEVIFRFTPGIFDDVPSCHLLDINAFSYTNSGTNEIKNFRSRIYILRDLTSSSIVQSVDECVDRDAFIEEVNLSSPYEYTLSLNQDPNFTRQMTIVVNCYIATNTDGLTSISLS